MHSTAGNKKPIQIDEFKAAIKETPLEEIAVIRNEIENSMSHLKNSNARLGAYIDKLKGTYEKTHIHEELGIDDDELDSIDANDLQLFSDSYRENDLVMDNYRQRIDILNEEYTYRTTGKSDTPSSDIKGPASIYL
ncbi:hypothetical protein KAFR_0A06810 [Kazachstania africana CBS 2517]|uniref:Uncharacterized protein n=1 Tax=Kazachstania africana (strain ATCC 22294 / BCRC 22015 / CBS 2517 / CECT 1963 / NBRC 1671 / NRRL Y-8276) TaxID=1071382 RepID=H2AP16_KAZAF|nr:hypothetical protein KAFR_0A06810 [Kazachstania africana CBS 2517]CCF56116.1 hypothetical protein KAFR_0A06810 [Kazachstania africana CBS 2517]